ncbi:hypothetical protein QEO94_07605 [Kingella negevensis]|uniref:hypothetical protein n=1 Tax=Kingella negevensis TaxID=1522312 RepID=UPI0025439D08|nr:hypothetical protein [Kingella negevensis]WII92507.1 hypothetical protein QEO94_07605 [Kingella negevensis]
MFMTMSNIILFVIFILWKLEFITLNFNELFIILIIVLLSLAYDIYKFFHKENDSNDEDDDVFFDNAPVPLNPTPLPPTSGQIEFAEFMKKMEKEKEENLVIKK